VARAVATAMERSANLSSPGSIPGVTANKQYILYRSHCLGGAPLSAHTPTASRAQSAAATSTRRAAIAGGTHGRPQFHKSILLRASSSSCSFVTGLPRWPPLARSSGYVPIASPSPLQGLGSREGGVVTVTSRYTIKQRMNSNKQYL